MKTYWGSGCIAPRILDLGTRWRWVVSFTPRQLYSQGKSPWFPLDRRLGGPQSHSGREGEEKNSPPPLNPWTPIVQPVAQSYTDWAIAALSIQKQTKINSIASTMYYGKTLKFTTIGLKYHHMHTFNFVINTIKTCRSCGLIDTWKIHYNSNFETTASSHVFWLWRKLWKLVSTLSTGILSENWYANSPSPNLVANAE
jgi:hypothetical protein